MIEGPEEKSLDAKVQQAVEDGVFSFLTPKERDCSIACAKRRKEARKRAEEIGRDLARLRRDADMTQEQLAEMIGTNRTDISRLESGRYGGLTIERFLAILDAIGSASMFLSRERRGYYGFGIPSDAIVADDGGLPREEINAMRKKLRRRQLLRDVRFPRGWGIYFELAKRDLIREVMAEIAQNLSFTNLEHSLYVDLLTIAELMYRGSSEHGLTICSFSLCLACPLGDYMATGGLCAAQVDDMKFRECVTWELLRRYNLWRSQAIEIGFSTRGTFRTFQI